MMHNHDEFLCDALFQQFPHSKNKAHQRARENDDGKVELNDTA
jgi:hypothetical protein